MLKLLATSVLLLISACTHPPVGQANGIEAVDLSSGRPVISARLGQLGERRVIFDTAAQGSLVRESLGLPLGLEIIGEAETGAGIGQGVTSPVVDFGPIIVAGRPAVDTAAVLLRDDLAPFGDAAGLLSPTMFSDAVVELDLAANTIWIGDRARHPVGEWFPIAPGDKLVALLNIGGVEIPVTLDTGSPRALVLPRRLADRVRLAGVLRQVSAVQTIETTVATWSAPVNQDATLAGRTVHLGEVQFAEWSNGNLGARGLRGFTIVVDNPNRRWALLGSAAGPISESALAE